MTRARTVGATVVSGLVAGVGMGVLVDLGTSLMPLIGGLYGWPTLLGGWAAHLLNSVVFAAGFVAVVSRPIVRSGTATVAGYVGLGVGYGAALGLLTGGVLFPLWLSAAEATGFAVPFLPIPAVVNEFVAALVLSVAHLVYGALLGATYALTSDALGSAAPAGTAGD